jgi:hypothetical protein
VIELEHGVVLPCPLRRDDGVRFRILTPARPLSTPADEAFTE